MVTPAFAAAIEGGMMLAPDSAASRTAASAPAATSGSRAARQALSLPMVPASSRGSTVSIIPSPADRGETSLSVQRLTPTTVSSPVSTTRSSPCSACTSMPSAW